MSPLERFLNPSSVSLKICGVTTRDDAERLVACGVDALGVNFWPQSKRHLAPRNATWLAGLAPVGGTYLLSALLLLAAGMSSSATSGCSRGRSGYRCFFVYGRFCVFLVRQLYPSTVTSVCRGDL
jgi:hypothetical protein